MKEFDGRNDDEERKQVRYEGGEIGLSRIQSAKTSAMYFSKTTFPAGSYPNSSSLVTDLGRLNEISDAMMNVERGENVDVEGTWKRAKVQRYKL